MTGKRVLWGKEGRKDEDRNMDIKDKQKKSSTERGTIVKKEERKKQMKKGWVTSQVGSVYSLGEIPTPTLTEE